MDQDGIKSDIKPEAAFNDVAENQRWAIRFGAEPFDFHVTGKMLGQPQLEKGIENALSPVLGEEQSGIGALANHNYIEIGKINDQGEFETARRVQGLGLDENWEMTGGGRLIGFVTGSKYTPFSEDLIQQDDPHATKPNQLEHADVTNLTGGDYTEIVFEGSERQVLQLYGAMVEGTIELNNQEPEFGLFGQKDPNSNSFNSEMKEKLNEMAGHMGVEIGEHDAWGLDIGYDLDLDTPGARYHEYKSLDEIRNHIDRLEQTAAKQLDTLRNDGIETDLETEIPQPGSSLPAPGLK